MTIPKQLLEAKICNKNTCELQAKEIERLNNIINEKEKEIQDLKQKNDYLNDLEVSAFEYKELQKETKRLNNIINELEKWCNELIQSHEYIATTWDKAENCALKNVLDKLKELKENR